MKKNMKTIVYSLTVFFSFACFFGVIVFTRIYKNLELPIEVVGALLASTITVYY